jgi:hypothetical protein
MGEHTVTRSTEPGLTSNVLANFTDPLSPSPTVRVSLSPPVVSVEGGEVEVQPKEEKDDDSSTLTDVEPLAAVTEFMINP